ncbi:MAG TPA: hypothetical protein VFA00_06830, partial [Actinomycetota bacterium]|nr:hypothetical protein [Actinomycetota bacterium]
MSVSSGPSRDIDPVGVPVAERADVGRGSRMLGRRAVLISTASTVVFFTAVAVAVFLSPGSRLVRER